MPEGWFCYSTQKFFDACERGDLNPANMDAFWGESVRKMTDKKLWLSTPGKPEPVGFPFVFFQYKKG